MGNKNNYSNAGFVQVGYPHNGCNNGCDNNDIMDGASCNNGCNNGCDNDNVYPASNGCGCDNGCTYTNGCGCENGSPCNNGAAYSNNGKWGKGRGHNGEQRCNCDCDSNNGDETHIFYESCDCAKEVSIISRCQEDEAMGRTLDVNCKLLNVCPGRRSALGITLTEMDENGAEYARGFRAITVPAHNGRCNQDVEAETVRFILPEDLSLQERRHFIVRTQHHYLDANNIWNNGWCNKH